jgi:hypothetical protein
LNTPRAPLYGYFCIQRETSRFRFLSDQNFSFRFLLDELTADFCKSISMIIMLMLKITTPISRIIN